MKQVYLFEHSFTKISDFQDKKVIHKNARWTIDTVNIYCAMLCVLDGVSDDVSCSESTSSCSWSPSTEFSAFSSASFASAIALSCIK